jgi:hypothetical protein
MHRYTLKNGDFEFAPLADPIGQALAQFVNEPRYSDVTFNVEGQRFHAHRLILVSRCEHFRAL